MTAYTVRPVLRPIATAYTKKKRTAKLVQTIKYFKERALRKLEDELTETAARYERFRKEFAGHVKQKNDLRLILLAMFRNLVIYPDFDKLQNSVPMRFEVFAIIADLIEANQQMDQNYTNWMIRQENFVGRIREQIMSAVNWTSTAVRDVATQRGTSQVNAKTSVESEEDVQRQTDFSKAPVGLPVCDSKSHGFYADDSVNPMDLVRAVHKLKTLFQSFSRRFWNSAERILQNVEALSPLDSRYSGVHFIRKHHVVSYGLKAWINEGFFKNFEKEDFAGGMIRTVNPTTRCKLSSQDDEDQRFSAFRLKKLRWLVKKFRLLHPSSSEVDTVVEAEQVLRALGGAFLLMEFDNVIREVWALHKVAFSFSSPAVITRFERGAAVDAVHMDAIEKLEDEDMVIRVGFTISPGFRLGNTIIRAEIYPDSREKVFRAEKSVQK
ncbi:hypothetical protein R1sor_027400 [Riccia sorocarpa]|uniref:GIL1/IRKI C-terminal domain-containing protein n=1 Tax=Riccia sorocarpa TaxID=122646 RepID=A0ABD3GGY9_9MARC